MYNYGPSELLNDKFEPMRKLKHCSRSIKAERDSSTAQLPIRRTTASVLLSFRLFETHPECKDVFFLFRDIDDLQQLKMSKELQSHGLRVMSFIEKSVARLAQEDKLEQLAFELGRSHYRYNAPPKYYEYVGLQFIDVVKPILKEKWTPDVEEAWKSLFDYLTRMMKRGYQEAEQRKGVNQASYAKQRAPSISNSNQNVI
ncbi:x globin [Heterodontus francisci]|uniref:x globin n=1 Tax=Heterodontus francisci TaxID=7792 RepID=UPI00355BE6A0